MSIVAGRYGAVRMEVIWAAIGKPALPPTDTICYRDRSSGAYLWITRGADDRNLVRVISLSTFRNCVGQKTYPAHGFAGWKTEKGIGLGSSRAAITKAYGLPDERINARTNRRDYLPWDNQINDFGAILKWLPHGDWVFTYAAPENSLSAASFGIAQGRVQWIWLSDNE